MSLLHSLPNACHSPSRRRLVQTALGSLGAFSITPKLWALSAPSPLEWSLTFQPNANCSARVVVDAAGAQFIGTELAAKDGNKYLSGLKKGVTWTGVTYDASATQLVVLLLDVEGKCGARITFGAPDDFQGAVSFADTNCTTAGANDDSVLKSMRKLLWNNEAHNRKNIPQDVRIKIAS